MCFSPFYSENTEQRGTGIESGSEWSNGTVHFDHTGPTEKTLRFPFDQKFWLNQLSRASTFQVSRETNSKTKRGQFENGDSVFLLLELFLDSEVDYDEIFSGDDDSFFFYSVASWYVRRKYDTTVFSRRIPASFPGSLQEPFSNDERKLGAIY